MAPARSRSREADDPARASMRLRYRARTQCSARVLRLRFLSLPRETRWIRPRFPAFPRASRACAVRRALAAGPSKTAAPWPAGRSASLRGTKSRRGRCASRSGRRLADSTCRPAADAVARSSSGAPRSSDLAVRSVGGSRASALTSHCEQSEAMQPRPVDCFTASAMTDSRAMTPSKTAIVTGAGKRVGARIARALLDDGWAVVAHVHGASDDVPEDAVKAVADLADPACAD